MWNIFTNAIIYSFRNAVVIKWPIATRAYMEYTFDTIGLDGVE